MSEFTVTVTPSETFPDNTNVTRAMLRNGATPQVSLSGTIGTSDISNGAVTDAKVAANAAIAGTKRGITQGALVAGGASNAGVILHPDTSVSGAFAAGGYDGENGNKRARFAVSRGTDPNEIGLLGTDISTAGGDIKIDVVNHRLKVEIEDGKVDARHIASLIGGQTDSAADAHNANPTIGVTGTGVDAYLRVLDDSIKLEQLGHVTGAYFGSIIGFTSDGSPAYIPKGAAGSLLKSNGNSNPTWETLYNDFSMGTAPDGAKTVRVKHGLTSTPTDLKWYLKCTSSLNSAATHFYKQGAIVYPSNFVDDHYSFNISADDTFVTYHQSGKPGMRYRGYADSAVGNENIGVATAAAAPSSGHNDWARITEANWEIHILAR